MSKDNEILMQHLREQIALEEHLCKRIQEQITLIQESDYSDAKELLLKTYKALELHFTPLNEALDVLESHRSTPSGGKTLRHDHRRQPGSGRGWPLLPVESVDHVSVAGL